MIKYDLRRIQCAKELQETNCNLRARLRPLQCLIC